MLLPTELSPHNFVSRPELETKIHATLPGWVYRFFGGCDDSVVDGLISAALSESSFSSNDDCTSDDAFSHMTPEQMCDIWFGVVVPAITAESEWCD